MLSVSKVERKQSCMYRKAISLLLLGNVIFVLGVLCARGFSELQLAARPVSQLRLELADLEERVRELELTSAEEAGDAEVAVTQGLGIAEIAVSGQRVVDYSVVEYHPAYEFPEEDMEALLRIVEAEAGSEDEEGRLLVANVVLNRVKNDRFPDTVTEVVFQQSGGVTQFSPVASGSYYKVHISEETISAVGRALMGEDISQGALYFASRKHADSSMMRWFDSKLTFLFEHGGHEFFK